MDWTGMTFRTRAEEKRAESRGRIERAKRGDTMVWCETCDRFVRLPAGERYEGVCPECGNPMFKMKCIRCGRMWYPRDPKVLPGTCPGCKSPYYNKARVRSGTGAPKITATPEQLQRVTERMDAAEPAAETEEC